MRTAEVTLPGFRHDLGAMNLSLFAGSPFHAEHAGELLSHGLALRPRRARFASPMRDGKWFGVSKDLETTIARAEKFSHEDAAAWRAMLARFGEDAPHIFALLGSPMTARALSRTAWKAWRSRGARWIADTLRLLRSSPRDFLEANFSSPEIRATLAAWGMHLDFAPDIPGGALFPYLEAMANQSFGMVIGEGGADTMIKAMVGGLEALGGAVHLNSEVVEVMRSSGRATGVRLANDEVIHAKRAVIAGVTPNALVARLLPAGSGNACVRLPRPEIPVRAGDDDGPPRDVRPARLDGGRRAETLRLCASRARPRHDVARLRRGDGRAASGRAGARGRPADGDRPVARAGRQAHPLGAGARGSRRSSGATPPAPSRRETGTEAKEAYADRVVDIIERYAPGTREKILARHVESPVDLERRNPNLVGGDQLAGSHHLSQNFLFRPMRGWARYATPVKDLYLIGASTWPGAGTGAGSGYMLAKMLADG